MLTNYRTVDMFRTWTREGHAFWIVMSIALELCGLAVYDLWKRDWF